VIRRYLAYAFVFAPILGAPALSAQRAPFPLTVKLTGLEGTWVRDPARGAGGICGVNPPPFVTIKVSASEITFDSGMLVGTGTQGTVRLDGTQTILTDGRTATATLDAGWLAVTMRRERGGGTANVMREVYIALKGELTIWRTLNVELPDGTQGKIDCGNHHAIVYLKK
jgi:hypothetical protein